MFEEVRVRGKSARSSRKWSGLWILSRQGTLGLALALVALVPVLAYGEDARKVKTSAPPEYPELARRMNIRGVARVEVTITPEGAVKSVKELGGNPVLVDALIRAVKKWKYEPADKTSVVEVKFDFELPQ
jgi:TonB family protein